MLAAYICCGLLCVASAVVGQAICSLCGADGWTWTAPAVGFAALLVVVDAAIRLPGGGAFALAAAAVVVAASALTTARRVELRPIALAALPVFIVLCLLGSGNYLANQNFGIPGVSVLNDFAGHLVWADALRTHHGAFSLIIPGYPLGPFALAGTLGDLPGFSVLTGFQGMLIATPVLIGLTTMSLFGGLGVILRTIAATVVSLAYLLASALAEGAFKEPIEALFAVAIALWLREFAQRTSRPRLTAAIPLAVLTAGSVANYSYPGLTWPALIIATWLVLEAFLRRRSISRAFVRRALTVSLVASGVLLVLALPEIVRFHAFEQAQVATLNEQTGNVPFTLPWSEVMGVWFRDDFRFRPLQPLNVYHGLLVFALVVIAYGVARAVRRRETALLALLAGALAVALYARGVANAYNDAKAMMVLSCAAVLLGVYGLFGTGTAGEPFRDRRVAPGFRIAGRFAALAFAAACLWSAGLAMRGSFVGPTGHSDQLARLRPMLAGKRVLFLAQDDFSAWELRGTHLGYLAIYDVPSLPVAFTSAKPFAFGAPADFDTIATASLDRFRFVVSPSSDLASVPPANWRRVAQTPSYVVWERTGPTPAHAVLAEGSMPGAVLDCSTRAGRALSRARGSALVRVPPIVLDGSSWQGPALARGPGASAVRAGGGESLLVRLPAGRWQLSMQYTSPTALTVSAPGLRATLPAALEHQGPYWAAGELVSSGAPMKIRLDVHAAPVFDTARSALLGDIAFVRTDTPPKLLPLRAACGRYVDWYVRA